MAKEISSAHQILKNCSLFKDVPDAQLEKLASSCSEKSLHAGETLFLEKEESLELFIVSKGTAVIKKSAKGSDQSVTQIGSGQHFGELAFLLRESGVFERRSATVEAGPESCVVLEVPYASLDKCFAENANMGAAFYRNIASSLAGRINRTTEDLAGIRALRLRST